ncbi:MAG: hypothetical protein P1V18_02110 [Candidatus Gracilibacteria bacterium]|nr:hypothetical protein [Candidatus Gracilibacteria bacterium]
MKQYIFIHGKNTSLSQAELRSLYGDQVELQTVDYSVISTEQQLSQADQDRLGGTIKICEVVQGDLIEHIIQNSKNEKILFGVSQYSGHKRLSVVLMEVKNELKKEGRNCRFLNKNFANISSGQLNKSNILEKGIDLVLCHTKGDSFWAQTIAFQNIDAYSHRDYDKPRRDMKVGMMPPKLTQIMINFAHAKKGSAIYDPFCGLGTTLLETALMGYQPIGSDIKGRLVGNSIQNLEWMIKEFGEANPQLSTVNSQMVFQHDATQPFPQKSFPRNLSVVTEGYLGPPLLQFPQKDQQQEIFDLLDGINSKFFSEISQIIPSANRIVMSFPYFRSKKEKVFYPEDRLQKYAEKNDFVIENEFRSLLYERETQTVGREIVIFKKS